MFIVDKLKGAERQGREREKKKSRLYISMAWIYKLKDIEEKRAIHAMDEYWKERKRYNTEESKEYWKARNIPFYGYTNVQDWVQVARNKWLEEEDSEDEEDENQGEQAREMDVNESTEDD